MPVFVTADCRHFRRLDRNERVRVVFLAERLDANTKEPGRHGGCLGRPALHLLRVMLFHFLSVATGRLDPSYDVLARASGLARSTVATALGKLEAAGILERVQRVRWARVDGRKRCVRATNAYRLSEPRADVGLRPTNCRRERRHGYRPDGPLRRAATPALPSKSDSLSPTTTYLFEQPKTAKNGPVSERFRHLLDILERRERRLGLTLLS